MRPTYAKKQASVPSLACEPPSRLAIAPKDAGWTGLCDRLSEAWVMGTFRATSCR